MPKSFNIWYIFFQYIGFPAGSEFKRSSDGPVHGAKMTIMDIWIYRYEWASSLAYKWSSEVKYGPVLSKATSFHKMKFI